MNGLAKRYPRILPVALAALLVVCHVAGIFCAMVPPIAMAAPSIQGLPIEHQMDGDRCSEFLSNSPNRDTTEPEALVVTPIDLSILTANPILSPEYHFPAKHLGVSLYTLLSTFRI